MSEHAGSNERLDVIERNFLTSVVHGYIGEEQYRIRPEDFNNPRHASFLSDWREWRANHPQEDALVFALSNRDHYDLFMTVADVTPGPWVYELMGDAAADKRMATAQRRLENMHGIERAEALALVIRECRDLWIDRGEDYEGSHEEFLDWIDSEEHSLRTGHKAFDELVFFEGGNLVIVAGTPSSGKSSFMLDTLKRFAWAGVPSEILSLEMRAKLLRRRLVANLSGVALDTIARKAFGPATRAQLIETSASISARPIKITKAAGWNVDRVCDRIQRSPAQVIGIDYVGLVGASERKRADQRTRASALASISNAIMQATVDSGKLVFLLSQLNRDSARENRPPEMHDLRDSGALEADAHVILGLFCPPDQRKDSTRPVQVGVLKNRDGMVSHHVNFDFHAPVSRFEERLAEEPAPHYNDQETNF